MGVDRIARNLGLSTVGILEWCKERILDKNCRIERRGKNWYASDGECTVTVNAHSYTVITAHKTKA